MPSHVRSTSGGGAGAVRPSCAALPHSSRHRWRSCWRPAQCCSRSNRTSTKTPCNCGPPTASGVTTPSTDTGASTRPHPNSSRSEPITTCATPTTWPRWTSSRWPSATCRRSPMSARSPGPTENRCPRRQSAHRPLRSAPAWPMRTNASSRPSHNSGNSRPASTSFTTDPRTRPPGCPSWPGARVSSSTSPATCSTRWNPPTAWPTRCQTAPSTSRPWSARCRAQQTRSPGPSTKSAPPATNWLPRPPRCMRCSTRSPLPNPGRAVPRTACGPGRRSPTSTRPPEDAHCSRSTGSRSQRRWFPNVPSPPGWTPCRICGQASKGCEPCSTSSAPAPRNRRGGSSPG